MFDLGKIIGMKVKAIRGRKERKNQKNIEATHILFDDRKTFIEFLEQDEYSYHDCCSSARNINVYQNKQMWERFANSDKYGDANIDF